MRFFEKSFWANLFRRNGRAAHVVLWLVVLVFFLQVSRVAGLGQVVRVITLSEPTAVWANREIEALRNQLMPGSRLLQWINTSAAKEDRFLVYRQAEFAYYLPDRRWIYDFDPKLADLYAMNDAAAAHRNLVERGITLAYLPNYQPATYYNSIVADVLGDPAYARPLTSIDAYRLLQVFPRKRDWTCKPILTSEWSVADGPGLTAEVEKTRGFVEVPGEDLYRSNRWTFSTAKPWFSSLTARGSVPLSREQARDLGLSAEAGGMLLRWNEENVERVRLATGLGATSLPAEAPAATFANRQISAEMRMAGDGFVQLYLIEFNSDGQYSVSRIWDAVLAPDRQPMTLRAQFQLKDTTRSIRLVVENGGRAPGWVALQGARACIVDYNDDEKPFARPDLPQLTDPPFGAFAEWIGEQLPRRFSIASARTWTGQELARANALTYRIGSPCELICLGSHPVDTATVDGRFFVQPAGGGAMIRTQQESGMTIFTDPVPRGLWRFLDVRWSSWLWGYKRSRANQDILTEPFAWFAEWYLPNRPDEGSRLWEVKMDARSETRGSTTISLIVYWDDAAGRTRASFVGPRILGSDQDTLNWRLPLPPDAQNVRAGFRVNNEIDRTFALFLNQIEINKLEPSAQ